MGGGEGCGWCDGMAWSMCWVPEAEMAPPLRWPRCETLLSCSSAGDEVSGEVVSDGGWRKKALVAVSGGRTCEFGDRLDLRVHHLGYGARWHADAVAIGCARRLVVCRCNRGCLDFAELPAQPGGYAVAVGVFGACLAHGTAQHPPPPPEEDQHTDHGQEDNSQDRAEHWREVRRHPASVARVVRGNLRIRIVCRSDGCVWIVRRDLACGIGGGEDAAELVFIPARWTRRRCCGAPGASPADFLVHRLGDAVLGIDGRVVTIEPGPGREVEHTDGLAKAREGAANVSALIAPDNQHLVGVRGHTLVPSAPVGARSQIHPSEGRQRQHPHVITERLCRVQAVVAAVVVDVKARAVLRRGDDGAPSGELAGPANGSLAVPFVTGDVVDVDGGHEGGALLLLFRSQSDIARKRDKAGGGKDQRWLLRRETS